MFVSTKTLEAFFPHDAEDTLRVYLSLREDLRLMSRTNLNSEILSEFFWESGHVAIPNYFVRLLCLNLFQLSRQPWALLCDSNFTSDTDFYWKKKQEVPAVGTRWLRAICRVSVCVCVCGGGLAGWGGLPGWVGGLARWVGGLVRREGLAGWGGEGYIPKCGQMHTWMLLVFEPSAAPRWLAMQPSITEVAQLTEHCNIDFLETNIKEYHNSKYWCQCAQNQQFCHKTSNGDEKLFFLGVFSSGPSCSSWVAQSLYQFFHTVFIAENYTHQHWK